MSRQRYLNVDLRRITCLEDSVPRIALSELLPQNPHDLKMISEQRYVWAPKRKYIVVLWNQLFCTHSRRLTLPWVDKWSKPSGQRKHALDKTSPFMSLPLLRALSQWDKTVFAYPSLHFYRLPDFSASWPCPIVPSPPFVDFSSSLLPDWQYSVL